MKAGHLLGRLIFGGFFLYSGINHFKQLRQMAPYAAAKGVPAPEAAVAVSGALLTVGGASVILGIRSELGHAAIVAFLASVSPLMHDFWTVKDPGQRNMEMVQFSKNMALLGAALMLMESKECR